MKRDSKALIPIVILGLALAGCGGSGNSSQKPAANPAPVASTSAQPSEAPVESSPPAAVKKSPLAKKSTPPLAVSRSVAGVVEPDKSLTPGAVFVGATAAQICISGWSSAHRSVSDTLRRQVFAEYGVSWSKHSIYEVDHLIPLELGGNNSITNLWPEPESGSKGASSKDRLENHLHDLVCSGKIALGTAQHAIAGDWSTAYSRYMSISSATVQHTTAPPVAPRPQPTVHHTTAPPVSSNGGATAKCNDGTLSFAAHHQGACSHHGGVQTFYK